MKPFDPRIIRTVPEARGPLLALGTAGAASGAATIATAFALTGVVVAIARGTDLRAPLTSLVAIFVVRALLAAVTEYVAARAGAAVSTALRRRLLAAWAGAPHTGSDSSATRLTLATAGATSIEPYVARYLPALIAAAVVPAAAVAALIFVDWPSALVVILTLPLLPLFAALIGRTTAEQTQKRWRALADLSGHFLDVVRGLPTLVNYGRARKQLPVIADVNERNRAATMGTLRLAFLSTGALELLATISVAIVAVLCGVRLAHGTMPLDTAMLAILLAPEAYWPVRRVGQEFHSAADGVLAFDQIADAIDAASATNSPGGSQSFTVRMSDVTYCYPGAEGAVLQGVSLASDAGLTALTGPSGVGKTTLLEIIAGLRAPDAGTVLAPACHLVTQRPFLPTGTLGRLLALGNDAEPAAQWAALRAVGLDGFVAALPDGLATRIGDDGFGLSAGQRARIGLARGLLAPESVILLDEPTAHLDAESAELAHSAIVDLATRRCVIAVTHRPELVALADQHIDLSAPEIAGAARHTTRSAGPR